MNISMSSLLGTALFVCTILLLGLSLPSVYRERTLANSAAGGSAFSEANRRRVESLLPQAGFPAGTPLTELASVASLSAGRKVLTEKCVRCHDLKTILDKPSSPAEWVAVVTRMARKPAIFAPITESDRWHTAAYLIAITPDLQKSEREHQETTKLREDDARAESPMRNQVASTYEISLKQAKETFQRVCSQCHAASRVEQSQPKTPALVQALILRMRDKGMRSSDQETRQISCYITKTFAAKPEGQRKTDSN